ncbi:MAG: adenylate kinase family protein [Candidatus Methylacidiphilales bacterium]|nr:nucleoside monophosphate kinase [Candidatus Methylacidiphilales bacterium]
MKFKTFLLFGAPGSGKGTQGKILGAIPGFYHCACGDVFRALDLSSPLGKSFLDYSSRGELVPDDLTITLWSHQIANMVTMGRFNPATDHLVLDGIPRNVNQARLLEDRLDVRRVFHLSCPNREKLVERLKRRALKDNRLDDANEEVIRCRLETYANESKPVLDFYGNDLIHTIDSTELPHHITRNILQHVDEAVPFFV